MNDENVKVLKKVYPVELRMQMYEIIDNLERENAELRFNLGDKNKKNGNYKLLTSIATIFNVSLNELVSTNGNVLKQYAQSTVSERKLRKERLLYDYIKQHIGTDGKFIMNDIRMSQILNVNKATIFRWRNILSEHKLIECRIRFVNGQKCSEITLVD